MKTDIKMPRLGVNDDYVTLAAWLIDAGDWINAGDAIASIGKTKNNLKKSTDAVFSRMFPTILW